MKYCEQCGTEVQDDNKFCSKCGAKCESDDIESSKKGRFLSGKKKKILLLGSGVLLAVLLIAGTASGFFSDIKKGYDEVGKEENDNTTPALSMEDFLKKYNETYQSAIKLEDFLIRGENDGFVVRDKDDLFADYTNYIHYYYNNGATEDSNNKEAVERATMVQLTGNQKIFEVLVGNENKIKAVEVTLKDGDFATAQNFMKIFIPSSREEDYPDLRNKAREDSVAYMYKNGVVVKVAENMIRIWYDTKENFETVSKQPFLSEKEEKQIIQNSVGVWEQESYSDLPILDISMPSDKALLITQYYSQGTDEYGNENYLKKECEVDVNEKEYADFTKDIEYTIKDYDGYECGSYHKKGNTFCCSHFIKKEILDDIVKHEIERQAKQALEESDKDELLKAADRCKEIERRCEEADKRIERLKEELGTVQKYKKKTYENFVDGILSKEEYLSYKAEYEQQEKNVRSKMEQAELEKESFGGAEEEHEHWMEKFIKYGSLEEVTREIVVELIDKIVIYSDMSIDINFKYQSPYVEAV